MPDPTTHPSPDELSAFAVGQLPPAEAARVETHISDCRPCCETLLSLQSDDTFVGLLQEAKQLPSDQTSDQETAGSSDHEPEIPAPLSAHPRYEIVGLIGKGGMGNVYQAKHRMMDRPVALKIINRELVQKQEAVERFHREAKTAARLSHPNIVTAYDAEQAGDVHFLVMEYVDGVDLSHAVKQRGALPIDEACDYIRQAAVGLQCAHENGMVHRDIKPHNLMVTTDGVVKILDFGLASLTAEPCAEADTTGVSSELTAAGSIMGTPDYISPEQADDARKADIRSDIYSLGTTLYFLLSGRPPFADGSVMHKLKSHAQTDPDPIASVRDDIPALLIEVLNRMIAKDPAERFQTPQEVADALNQFTTSAVATTPETLRNAKKANDRRRMAWIVALALVVLTGAIGFAVAPQFFEQGGQDTAGKPGKSDTRSREDPAGNRPAPPVEKPELIRKFVGHEGPVWEVVFSSDGTRAASCSARMGSKGRSAFSDGMIRIWDVKTGKVLHEWKVLSDRVRGLAFSPNGKQLLTGTRHCVSDSTGERVQFQLWDVETGSLIRQSPGGEHSLSRLMFVDDERAVSCHYNAMIVFDVKKGTVIFKCPQAFDPNPVDVHAATDRAAIAGRPTTVRIINLRDGSEFKSMDLGEIAGSDLNVLSIAMSPDGRRLTAAIAMKGTFIWSVETGKQIHKTPLGAESLKWTQDGRHVIGAGDGHWFIYDAQLGQTIYKRNLSLRPYSVALAPDGRSVLLGGGPRWHFPEDNDFALQHWRLPKSMWPEPGMAFEKEVMPKSEADPMPLEADAGAEANTEKREHAAKLFNEARHLVRQYRLDQGADKPVRNQPMDAWQVGLVIETLAIRPEARGLGQ